jgi:hypothetical protein
MGKGQWIVENLAWLSNEEVEALPADLRSGPNLGYVGFKAIELAEAMGITVAFHSANVIAWLRQALHARLRISRAGLPAPGRFQPSLRLSEENSIA